MCVADCWRYAQWQRKYHRGAEASRRRCNHRVKAWFLWWVRYLPLTCQRCLSPCGLISHLFIYFFHLLSSACSLKCALQTHMMVSETFLCHNIQRLIIQRFIAVRQRLLMVSKLIKAPASTRTIFKKANTETLSLPSSMSSGSETHWTSLWSIVVGRLKHRTPLACFSLSRHRPFCFPH